MAKYFGFPPEDLLTLVLKTHPECGLTYIKLFKENGGGDVKIAEKLVKVEYLVSHTIFGNHLMKLAHLGLIDYEHKKKTFTIALKG